jgi:hypothetical protein
MLPSTLVATVDVQPPADIAKGSDKQLDHYLDVSG